MFRRLLPQLAEILTDTRKVGTKIGRQFLVVTLQLIRGELILGRTMDKAANDSLWKPDMVAILGRTHLTTDLKGFLLPIFESLSNAFDGIEERFGDETSSQGRIAIRFKNLNDSKHFFVSITDNGLGLNSANYGSFRTPFSGQKLLKRGRGFGRFISFKVFNRIHYSSRYNEKDSEIEAIRCFRFDITKPEEIIVHIADPDFQHQGLAIELDEPQPLWANIIEGLNKQIVLDEIGAHFLPYFLNRGLPSITVQFDDEDPEDIARHFSSTFHEFASGSINCEIDGVEEELNYSLTRIPKSKKYNHHSLLLSAADRIVGASRDLTRKLGVDHFVDGKGEKYIIVAVVSGAAFEGRLNDARTSIALPSGIVEDIVGGVCSAIEENENEQVKKIQGRQTELLTRALMENPILRLGLRGSSMADYIQRKPNNWRAENFVSDLAMARYRASNDLSKKLVAAAHDPEVYQKTFEEISSRLDEGRKEALAEYILHRRSIIEMVDAARKFDAEGKRGSEDRVHSLIFKRFSDTTETDYFEHNLWLIDDALAFLPYVSSDRTTHGGRRQLGDKVTDLLFFNESMVLGEDEGTTLTIVEFKKPSRNDYSFGNSKTDPVMQVIETLEKAVSSGGIQKKDGAFMSFSHVSRRTAYIIADLTPTLIRVLKNHDFRNDYDSKTFTRYHTNGEVFIQVFGYDTLISQAKKRNQAFFTVLLGE